MGADGQLGRVIEDPESGVLMVRLDRRAQEMILPLREGEWSLATGEPMTPMWRAAVCYDADRRLRMFFGEYSIKEWASLGDVARQAWLRGPPADAADVRHRLYRAMQEELRK